MADANLPFQRRTNFLVKLQCSATLFLEGSQLIFFSKKIRQMKAGQNNKYYITKTKILFTMQKVKRITILKKQMNLPIFK